MSAKSELPTFAYGVLPGDTSKVVLIKRGHVGYWETYGLTHALADLKNIGLGVTPAMREAMRAGSIFGWDVPVASKPEDFPGAKTLVEEYGA